MTEVQAYILATAIAAGFAGVITAIRFTGGRIVRAMDLNTASNTALTASNAAMMSKFDTMANYIMMTPHGGVRVGRPDTGG